MGAFVPFEQICKLLSESQRPDFMTPVLAGQMNLTTVQRMVNPFRHEDGPYDVYGGQDHIFC
jgi:hypothetical protein